MNPAARPSAVVRPSSERRYTGLAIVLHWLMALALIGNFCVGLYMADLAFSPVRLKLYNWHKWAGICILTLALLRLLWRLGHPPPPSVPMPRWQALTAHFTHFALYVLFFAVPLMGWAYSSSAGFSVVLFGVWQLPNFVAPDKALAGTLRDAHAAFAWALAALVGLHVAGALKHQLIDRDGLIFRMWPARGLKGNNQ